LQNEAFLSNELNFNKDLPCFFLGYENSELIAFLSAFIPMENEAEVVAFTHPAHRKLGHFTALLNKAVEMLKKAGIHKILFLLEPCSRSGESVLKKYSDIKWERTEYQLVHSGNIPVLSNTLKLQSVNMENIELCIKLTDKIFNKPHEKNDNFVLNAINSPDREIFIAFKENEPVGTFNLHYLNDTTFIYGFGIAPEYQGKGYGKQLLNHALNVGFTKSKKVTLDVDSDNPPAYKLYINSGFVIDFQVDYYCYVF
jgi:ribosomal protein S18 acetylase RimI-like enzyme